MRTVNVGLIGAGFMGKAHSLAYAALPMFYWPAPAMPVRKVVADVNADAAAEAALRFGFERSTDDWRRVVDDPEVDLVDIATPNNLHAEIAAAAAAAGKHIICEKPLARTGAEAAAMYRAVRDADIVHMVAFNYRRTPAVALARKYIDEGAVGRVLNFRGTYLQDWSADPDSPLSWRFQKSVAGSGALGDIGTHVLDIARYLVGEVASVNSVLSTFIPDRPIGGGGLDKLGAADRMTDAPRGPVDVDDELITMLRFSGGAVGTVEATRNAYGRNNFLTFEVHGTEGSLYFNYERRDELQVCFASDPGDRRGFRTVYTGPAHPYGDGLWPIPALGIGYGETKIIEAYDLLRGIVDKTPVSPDFGDGYQVALICDAITASAESGRWVDVPHRDAG
ncbi:Gfo/Idh/MocA family protein [Planosporangium mesophilum]|uniref:Oxidoreductase n=1 Tax=Planosporangium mesophilum TaxID=689768 RepID=A0A8J3TKG4_9ACTN|nr:Gfo/Idh/MocA family oxidoreductase [Planosporangium mesophilum]NJC86583.1 Gfo/Idh/MocA family oxidoreductase [Planosporangium mesophilum]GII26249.1 oxidoreductase [Planosporangium mesophilum]